MILCDSVHREKADGVCPVQILFGALSGGGEGEWDREHPVQAGGRDGVGYPDQVTHPLSPLLPLSHLDQSWTGGWEQG